MPNISQDSRPTDGTTLIYADIGPNAVSQVQKVVAPDHSNYKVQYAAIDYNAKAPQNLCVPNASMTKIVEDELISGISIAIIIKYMHNISIHLLIDMYTCQFQFLYYEYNIWETLSLYYVL